MAIQRNASSGMVDLELHDEDQFDAMPMVGAKPTHPWGMRIAFEDAQIEACEIDFDALKDGDEIEFHACGKVTSFGSNDGKRRFEVQITHICVEDETQEGDEGEEE